MRLWARFRCAAAYPATSELIKKPSKAGGVSQTERQRRMQHDILPARKGFAWPMALFIGDDHLWLQKAETSMSVLSKSEPGNARYYDYHGWIRRIDLSLRTRYPNLETRIFETAPNRYVIVFDRTLLDAVAIREEFDSIRFVTTNAVVANDVPERYLREITPLGDEEIARDFAGIPFTQGDLSNLLAAQFPNLPITAVRDGGDPMTITIELSESISKED